MTATPFAVSAVGNLFDIPFTDAFLDIVLFPLQDANGDYLAAPRCETFSRVTAEATVATSAAHSLFLPRKGNGRNANLVTLDIERGPGNFDHLHNRAAR